MLHLGVFWIVVGYLADAATMLGLPPRSGLHFWTLGLITLVFSVAIRVMRGHGGQPLKLGADGAVIIGLVQVAIVGRAVLPLLAPADPLWSWTLPLTALGLAFGLWGVRHGPMVGQMSDP